MGVVVGVVIDILVNAEPTSADDWNPNYQEDAPTTVEVGSGGGGGGGSGSGSGSGAPQPPKKPHRHHPYLKALGGAVAQQLVKITPELHRQIHSALYKFEKGWLAPKRGYTGQMIRDMYSAKEIQQGLMRFYNSNEAYKFLIDPLVKAIEFTGKKS